MGGILWFEFANSGCQYYLFLFFLVFWCSGVLRVHTYVHVYICVYAWDTCTCMLSSNIGEVHISYP